MLNDSRYVTQNPQKISHYLSILIANKRLITIQPSNTEESFISVLYEMDAKNKLLLFDLSPDVEMNKKLLSSDEVYCSTQYNGISVAFTSKSISKKQTGFAIQIPSSMLWQERREYYRVRLPLSQVGQCHITHPDQTVDSFTVHDISISGFALLVETQNAEIPKMFTTGAVFEQAQLMLPNSPAIEVQFSVCDIVLLSPEKIRQQIKVGCKFNKISLSGESIIQRCMQRIELEKKQKTL